MHMIEYDFERKFEDLKYFEVGFFLVFLEFILYLRSSSPIFLEHRQFSLIW